MLSTTHASFKSPTNTAFQPETNYKKSLLLQEAAKVVLKFYGFFTEDVPQSRLETMRIRELEISVFTADNTISIIEPRQRNSGILQGLFLKRQNVLANGTNSFITAEDFVIGQMIVICGHNIFLYSCDPFTRKFYQKVGRPQPEDVNCPTDNFRQQVLKSFEPKPFYGLNSYAFNGCVPSQKQFLENNRKVLKFYATFDNELYIIHYYLCDDCIEVIEIKVPNSGKDPFPKLIKRQKMAKSFKVEIHPLLKQGDYYTYADIKEGEEINLLGKSFLILGCDPFTAKFYKEKMGIEFGLYKCQFNGDDTKVQMQIPPHNGFGSEEDTLQNVLRLLPKVPKKDYFSIVDNVGFLRLIAKLLTNEDENRDR